ncbi:YhcN/YlaJ family sporulation lipoprotein [Brevibacillus fluminis]|uniref:YhcN/YlaJ family sporulation lipoprotein n=1 Tax=Brevibacillus fluminis TaxID=511487 RepID=A0A3M8DSH6_9BACL|nr:YhcN/YlaJ family sporulation lipoprotein [Brevibacillus fluminis]RNB91110.1 YhcN/YlaJ family sporulation lipoprotein [Brevibacillus fluminis]
MIVIRYAILLIGASLALFGCTRENPQALNNAAPKQHQAKTQAVPQTAPQPAYNQSPQAKAERLSQLASRVKKVHSATSVVAGNWAVVGITVDPALDRPEVGVIKYSVAEALKADPQGANAIVTADPAIVQRLREMSVDMKHGKPIKGIAEELSDIVGRIMPQLPKNVQKNEQPRPGVNHLQHPAPGNHPHQTNQHGTPPASGKHGQPAQQP